MATFKKNFLNFEIRLLKWSIQSTLIPLTFLLWAFVLFVTFSMLPILPILILGIFDHHLNSGKNSMILLAMILFLALPFSVFLIMRFGIVDKVNAWNVFAISGSFGSGKLARGEIEKLETELKKLH